MRTGPVGLPVVPRLFVWVGIALLGTGATVVRAQDDAGIDIRGALATGPSVAGSSDSTSGKVEVRYQIIFQYIETGSQGISPLDRAATIVDGRFQISDLKPDKTYMVSVQREVLREKDGPMHEIVAMNLPAGFYEATPLASTGGSEPRSFEIELLLGNPEPQKAAVRSLNFFYDQKSSSIYVSSTTEYRLALFAH
jgi:hypothetical protein